jgi:hypothetical protein
MSEKDLSEVVSIFSANKCEGGICLFCCWIRGFCRHVSWRREAPWTRLNGGLVMGQMMYICKALPLVFYHKWQALH